MAGAKSALEFLRAAIDDSAKALRTSLHEDQPCPVCGSLNHPYRHEEPDYQTTAIEAAERKLAEREQHRDSRQRLLDQIELATANRAEQMKEKLAKRTRLLEDVAEVQFDAPDHPHVAEILTLHEAERQPAVLQHLAVINSSREELDAKERAFREAVKRTSSCRRIADAEKEKLAKLQGELAVLDKSFSVAESEWTAAENTSQQADKRLRDAVNSLTELWNGVPDARNRFDADGLEFRELFESSTAECGAIQTELSELASEIQKANAAIGPLEESLAAAGTTLTACNADVESATGEYHALATERNQIFDGRPADDVERELTGELKTAAEHVEAVTTAKHESEKLLAASREAREAASRFNDEKASALQSARDEMRAWLTAFTERTVRSLSLPELDAVLLRDEAWINGERQHLKSLDEAVQSAEGACRVRSQQLQEHQKNRSTDEEEPVVLAAVENLQRTFGREGKC